MKIQRYNQKLEKGSSGMSALDKDMLLAVLFVILADAVKIFFPDGSTYKKLKWYSWKRWAALGKIAIKIFFAFYGDPEDDQ